MYLWIELSFSDIISHWTPSMSTMVKNRQSYSLVHYGSNHEYPEGSQFFAPFNLLKSKWDCKTGCYLNISDCVGSLRSSVTHFLTQERRYAVFFQARAQQLRNGETYRPYFDCIPGMSFKKNGNVTFLYSTRKCFWPRGNILHDVVTGHEH